MIAFSREFLEDKISDKTCAELALKWARRLRKIRRISVQEIIDAARILKNYASLAGYSLCEELPLDEVGFVLESVYKENLLQRKTEVSYPASRSENEDPDRYFRSIINRDIMILGARYGGRVRTPSPEDKQRFMAYNRLKLLGAIRRRGKREYIVSRRELSNVIKSLARHKSVEEAVASRIRSSIASGVQSDVEVLLIVMQSMGVGIGALDIPTLVRIMMASRGRRRKYQEIENVLVDTIRSKLDFRRTPLEVIVNETSQLRTNEWKYITDNGLIDASTLARIIESNPRILPYIARNGLSDASKKLLARALEKISDVRALSYIITRKRLLAFLDPKLETRLVLRYISNSEDGLVAEVPPEYAHAALRIKEAIFASLSHSDSMYIDFALQELRNSIPNGSVVKNLEPLMTLAEAVSRMLSSGGSSGRDWYQVEEALRRLGTYTALEFLTAISNNSGLDPAVRSRALRLSYLLLRRVLSRGDKYSLEKKKLRRHGSRIAVRETIRRLLGLHEDFLVFREREQRPRIVLVLDKSGSMRPYALNTVLAAAALAPFIAKMILFDENIYSFNLRGSLTRADLVRLVDTVLSIKFSGYTDLVSAIREAIGTRDARKMIIITDLRQTVNTNTALEDIFAKAASRFQVIVLSPPSVDYAIVNKIKSLNVAFHIIDNPSKMRQILMKIV